MLENIINDLIYQYRLDYKPSGKVIKGINNQYWLVLEHKDINNPISLDGLLSLFGLGEKPAGYYIFRIDLNTAEIYQYIPQKDNYIPSTTILRTASLEIIQEFLKLKHSYQEKKLLAGSFLEIESIHKRRFSLPTELDEYNQLFNAILERSKIYRRSTAYFDSGVLKLYEEPLYSIAKKGGEIRLLMDWQGFTKDQDLTELEKVYNTPKTEYYLQNILQKFLQNLDNETFKGTEILTVFVQCKILTIKLVKMNTKYSIYHKKTGICSDSLDNHILHEGSDNFTTAAHSRNAESVTFLYYSDKLDKDTIIKSIQQFDQEWVDGEYCFDITSQFLREVLAEKQRRVENIKPTINSIDPHQMTAGETITAKIKGQNLQDTQQISIPDNPLIQINLTKKTKTTITTEFIVNPDHPPTEIKTISLETTDAKYQIDLITSTDHPITIIQSLKIPAYSEILGFQQTIENILNNNYGPPQDFLYWLAQQRPQLWRVQFSDLLDQLVYEGILFEHQKSGAQHCLRVMKDFGVSVCADAVGLGKTRLAAAVAKLYRQETGQAKIAIIASKKLFLNWEREMQELGFKNSDYELYNKNLMSRTGNNFINDFSRYGGPDFIIIDEAHEGIRNYKNRVHRTCVDIKNKDIKDGRLRHFLLLTATPWNNRREDIYNILAPFLGRPDGFQELNFPPEIVDWFAKREAGVENFTDNTTLFRKTYRELFLQRTRKMLKEATPNLNLYAKRTAEWLPVIFESDTETALEKIFTQFEHSLFIPFSDPVRYLTENIKERSILSNQRRFFLQRAESSMYALNRTIDRFSKRVQEVKDRLSGLTADLKGLKEFLLLHYEIVKDQTQGEIEYDDEAEDWEEEEQDEDETDTSQENKRQKLITTINNSINNLANNPEKVKEIYYKIISDCDSDLTKLQEISQLLQDELVKDHKREVVTQKVKELVSNGHKVLLISIFSDTVIDYYQRMKQEPVIINHGVGMSIGSQKKYYPAHQDQYINIYSNNLVKGQKKELTALKREQIFRLFAPQASVKNPVDYPSSEQEIAVLIGSETLSVGQNLQDADYLINIDLPWNPMILEQRIGRIDRPKQHKAENIYIYYANSESQLLRQASRLANLNKKLIGELAKTDQNNQKNNRNEIPNIASMDSLGASVYGDTLFDDEILPGYIDFINNLVNLRKLEQKNLQESVYQSQEIYKDLYTQQELLYSEDLKKLVEQLGENYQPQTTTVGHYIGQPDEPQAIFALNIDYFGPNQEPIPSKQQTIYWNNLTGEIEGFGTAIATGFKTRQKDEILSNHRVIALANEIYQQLVLVKQQYLQQIDQSDNDQNVAISSSERLRKIQQRITNMKQFPTGIEKNQVKAVLKMLNQNKELKNVQKVLKEFADSPLSDEEMLIQLIDATNQLSLMTVEEILPTYLEVSVAGVLFKF